MRFLLWAAYRIYYSKMMNFCQFIQLAFSDATLTDFVPTGDEENGHQLEMARVYRVTKKRDVG